MLKNLFRKQIIIIINKNLVANRHLVFKEAENFLKEVFTSVEISLWWKAEVWCTRVATSVTKDQSSAMTLLT